MADSKEPAMSDDRIIASIDLGISQAVGFSESKLSKERERVQRFYDGELPAKAHAGDSSYVSDDVFQGIESMKAQLLDVFTANGRPVKFKPVDANDVPGSVIRTDYVTHVLFDQNPGFGILRDVIEEGLKSRAGIIKVWWDTAVKWRHMDLSDVAREELLQWLQDNPTAEIIEADKHIDGFTFKRVRVKVQVDVSQVRVRQLAGEEFGISPMSENIPEADLVYHRHEMTVSDLLEAGYDKNKIKDLQSDDRLWMGMEPEKIARFMPTDDLIGTKTLEDGQAAQRVILVYECYLKLDLDGDGESQLFKVVKVGNTILEKEPVDRKPFIAFVPLPRPNAFWGQNYALKLTQIQVAKSYLTRSVVNHVLITNNPKILVGQGGLANPRELMENRFGGIVNVKDPSKVVPMPQAGLNPFVFQTMQMLDQQKQESTGISSLSQGLNKDAISSQNSGDMVHELITVSQMRQKIIARCFAEDCLRELYTEIYRLVLENEKREKIVQLAGQWVPVDPSQWPEDCQCAVSFALGYGEQEKEAQKWIVIGKALEADPMLTQWYTPQEHHYVAQQALQAAGLKDVASILRPFDKAVQPPPNPLQQAEVSMKNADAAAKNAQAQATQHGMKMAELKLQSEHQIAMEKIHTERLKIAADAQGNADQAAADAAQGPDHAAMGKLDIEWWKAQRQAQLEQDKLAHLITVDAAEMALQVKALEVDKLTANAQPRG